MFRNFTVTQQHLRGAGFLYYFFSFEVPPQVVNCVQSARGGRGGGVRGGEGTEARGGGNLMREAGERDIMRYV